MKRVAKRKIRTLFNVIFFFIFSFILIFILLRYIYPFISKTSFLNVKISQNKKIINPVVQRPQIDDLRKNIEEKGIELTSLEMSTKSAVIVGKIKNGPKIYFSGDKDVEWQASSLQLIVSRLTIDNKKPNLIDLRFDKPIVKY